MSWLSKIFGGSSSKAIAISAAQQAQAAEEARQAQEQAQAAQNALAAQIAAGQEASAAQLAEANRISQAAQRAAEEAQYRASLSPADSEDARAQATNRVKRLLSKRGLAAVFGRGGPTGSAETLGAALTGA